MIRIISEQISAFGPITVLYDTCSEETMLAVDLRDYKGAITPQYADAVALVLYPDDVAWVFAGAEKPEYYGYVKPFASYDTFCSWFNQQIEI